MGIRRGKDYIHGLRDSREVWVEGERVDDVTTHPAFARGIGSIAELYDLQFDTSLNHEMTYRSPSTGNQVGLSFLIPKSVEDLLRRRRMLQLWSEACYGMLGRSPDFMNSILLGLVEAKEFLSRTDSRFGGNVLRYYERCRENDLCLTHAIIDPQIDRSKDASQQADPYLYLGLVREGPDGITIRGAKMLATLGPYADEILVYPNRPLGPHEAIYALAFAVPVATKGLKLICREPIDRGQSRFDHPLASRFEEMDVVAVFSDVHVPWNRVFLKGEVELANKLRSDTPFINFPVEQSVMRNLVKAEFVAGLAMHLAETIGITHFLHVQEKLGELVNVVEMLRACLDASVVNCPTLPSGTVTARTEPLVTARNLFPRLYPKMIETLQILGAGGLLMIPTEKDLTSPIAGEIEKYYQGAKAGAKERIKLFKLAWDVAGEAFGQRQVQYERYFNGDPVRVIARRYQNYDKSRAIGLVKKLLSET